MPKREYAAYTIRPKIQRLLAEHLKPVPPLHARREWREPTSDFHTTVEQTNIASLVRECEIDHSVRPSVSFSGGRNAAEKLLAAFIEQKLRSYARERNEPSAHATSELSPYLHFGNMSSLEIALAAKEHAANHGLIVDEYLEELIVRRELAFNYARLAGNIASFEHLPEWSKQTMTEHAADRRDPSYSRDQFEHGQTHDPLWNATQKEMLLRGKIHGYYRMYWGKKIIEWSPNYQEALETMLYLHARYALDGRDPNTYANILWCFGLHDRPWPPRPIYGTIRSMSHDGMRRKTDTQAYIKEIDYLERMHEDRFRLQ